MSSHNLFNNNNDDHDEEIGEEIWLLSYSDLMTLLFGFFVLMYSFAAVNTSQESESVKRGLARAFGGSYQPPLEDVTKKLNKLKSENIKLSAVRVDPIQEGLEITFQSGLLFQLGKAEILPEMVKELRNIIKIILENAEGSSIHIQGHTDDLPIHTDKFPSNWELSTARASAVVRQFIKYGFNQQKVMAQGFAETRPAFPNLDDLGVPITENRKRNRRVVIKVIAPGIVEKI